MKLSKFQTVALTTGLALSAIGILMGGLSLAVPADPTADCAILQPNEQRGCVGRGDDGHLVMLFPRSGPCYTCGAPAEIWLKAPDGRVWHIPSTVKGTIEEVALKYCEAATCDVYNVDPATL